jgi:predicted GTPase
MSIDPELKINILVMGCISAGKSTFMNGILSNSYSCCKIKRTTMIPQIYNEKESKKLSSAEIRKIREHNDAENKKYIIETEKADFKFECKSIEYDIPKIADIHQLAQGISYSFCDMPGINDARTKDHYVKFIKENFYKFDIILFIVDVKQPVGTTDINDTLTLCMEQIKLYKSLGYNKYMITIANKFDDNLDFTDELIDELIPEIDDEELREMFEDVKTLITGTAKKYDVSNLCNNVIPMSCEDVYIYRTIKHNNEPDLDLKYLDKIGIDEYGKTNWKKMKKSEGEKYNKLAKKLSKAINDDPETYKKRMRSSGFEKFNMVLNNLLDTNNQYTILHNKFTYYFETIYSKIFDNFVPEKIKLFDLSQFSSLLIKETQINNIFKKKTEGKWIVHNKLIYKYTNLLKNILIFCSTNKDIIKVDDVIVMIDNINKIYTDIKSTDQKKYVQMIIKLGTEHRKIVFRNRCDIVKEQICTTKINIKQSFEQLVNYESKIEDDLDEMKTLLNKIIISGYYNTEIIEAYVYLYSVSTKPHIYTELLLYTLSLFFKVNYSLSYDCMYQLFLLKEQLSIKNKIDSTKLKYLLESIYIFNASKNIYLDFSNNSCEQYQFIESIVNMYTDISNKKYISDNGLDQNASLIDFDNEFNKSDDESDKSEDESDKSGDDTDESDKSEDERDSKILIKNIKPVSKFDSIKISRS